MDKDENTNNGNGLPNAMWGNMNWGNTPPYYGKQGASGLDIAALVLGIAGTAFGLASGGMGLFNQNRNQNGQNGGPNVMERLSAVEAAVAVNTQRDIDLAEQTKLQIENAKLQAKLDVKDSQEMLTALITGVNNQVITNTGVLGCVEGKVNGLIKIGIPEANIIPTAVAAASTNG